MLREKVRIIVLGSTHLEDEILLLPVINSLRLEYNDLKFILVPRHTERSPRLCKEIASFGLKVGLWSSGDSLDFCDVLVVDVMGILSSLYSVATLAFVGGTFDKSIGGHNLLEPLFAGVPLIFGPHTFSQSLIATEIDRYEAGYVLADDVANLFCDFKKLLKDSELRETLIKNGSLFLNAQHRENPLNLTRNFAREFISLYKNRSNPYPG